MIDIEGKYAIESEPIDYSAWVVTGKTRTDKRSGKTYPSNELIGYFSSVGRCVEAIKDYEVHKSLGADVYSLEQAISEIERINKEFKEKRHE